MEENNTSNNPPEAPGKIQKKHIYIAAAGVVVLFILFLIFRNKENIDTVVPEEFIENPPAEQIIPPTSTTSSAKITPTAPKRMADAPLSATQKYLDALRIYKNSGYYFQFVECHGLPGSLTMKKGKKFMLDNRDNKTRRIAIAGGQSFKIGAYGFAIATAPSKAGTYYITCDGGGAAKIVVQQ